MNTPHSSFDSRPFTTHLCHQRHQCGFTLVEIMVAMAISLLMMAGVLQISLANKESSRLQRNMGFVQENIRMAMELLGRDIRMAGHYTDNNPAARILSPIEPFINVTDPTTNTRFTVTADGSGYNNDQITLTYESDLDCLTQETPAPSVENGNRFAINHYFINSERLMCRGNGGDAQSLVEGVESMQILYGENTDGDPRSANRYVRPEQIDNMSNVVSVRIALRFHSREAVRPTADPHQYALLDATAFTPAVGDRRLRREITTTIFLRN